MRKLALALLAFCLGVGVATAVAQRPKDAVIADPDVHNVVMENEHVRILEARAPVGYKSPMHSHPPIAVISLGSARLRLTGQDGQSQIVDLRPGGVLWFDNAAHSWELFAGNLHVIAVEVKNAKPAAE